MVNVAFSLVCYVALIGMLAVKTRLLAATGAEGGVITPIVALPIHCRWRRRSNRRPQ